MEDCVGRMTVAILPPRRGLGGQDVQQWVDRYVADRVARGEFKPYTARQVRWRLCTFARLFDGLELAGVRREHVVAWERTIGWQRPTSRRAYLSSLKTFFRWAIDEEIIDVDPTARLAKVREPRSVPRALSEAQMARLVLVLPDGRARLVVALMGRLGLRCCEVARLAVADWDTGAGTLFIRGKADNERTVAVPGDVEAALRAHLGRRTSGPVVGSTAAGLGRQVAAWMERAGLKATPYDGMSAHALRHTAASDALDRCGNVRVVQQLLGHANLATTDRYLRRADLAAQRAALELGA
jgi:site-specific recombinase XerD